MKRLKLIILSLFFSSVMLAQSDDTVFVSLTVNNIEFTEFASEIERQTDLMVIYKNDWIKNIRVTVDAKEKDVVELLNQVLAEAELSVIRWGDQLVVLKNEDLIEQLPNYNKKQEDLSDESKNETTEASSFIKGRRADLVKIKVGKKNFKKRGGEVNVSGKVIDAVSGEAIEGATLYINELQKGAATDVSGNLNISLPSGIYSATFDCLGRKALSCQIEVLSQGSFKIALEKENYEIQEVQIYGDRQMDIREKEPGLEKLNVKAIKELPTMMGESDIIKVTEMLPGVVSVGEGAAGLNVRGGGFDQNAFYFNKITVYNTSHLFGFFPAFNADVIQDFSLYKGYIPAKYGGRLSSIFNINARTGNKKNYTVHGGVSPATANITVEGPIKRDTASFLVNFRSSYSDWILNQVKNYDIQNSEASFYDLTASLDYDLPNTQINIFGYHSQDYFKFSNINTYWYSNSGLSASFGHIFAPSLRGDFSISASQYEFRTIDEQVENAEYEHDFKIDQYEFSANFKKVFSRKNTLEFGFNSNWYQLNRGEVIPYGDNSNKKPLDLGEEQGLEAAIFISDNIEITPLLTANAGFRFSMYSSFGPEKVYTYYDDGPIDLRTINDSISYNSGEAIKWYNFPEFRLSLNYQTDENGSIKFAFNQMHQSMFMLNNTISLSPNTQWKLADYHLVPSRANQFSLGMFRTIPQGDWEISLEFFYKRAKDYTEFKDGADFLSTPLVETTVLQGDLTSYGVELLIKKSWMKLDLWLAYTFSRSLVTVDGENDWERINDGKQFPSNFDIPHVVNAIGTYHFTKRISFSTTVTYQTGKPASFPTSFYYYDEILQLDYSNRNEFRIPDYFRTDISFTIEGNLKKEKFLHSTLNFSVYNLTGRKNAYSVYFEEDNGKIEGYQYSVIGVPIFMVTWLFKLGNYDAQ